MTSGSLSRGKATKFTPERIQQITNLVERGKSRDEIADILGVTVGSLQVTCSRLGISLRRPKVDNRVLQQKRQPHAVIAEPNTKKSPSDFGKFIADETEKWGKVIRAANIKPA